MSGQAEPEGVEVAVTRLPHGKGLALPTYQSAGAAGMDLLAAVPPGASLEIAAGNRVLIPTGIAIALPAGYEAQVRPRSGLAVQHGVGVLNAPGTIDTDYRGEIKVLLVNYGSTPFEIVRGDRIAQLVVAPVARAALIEQETLDTTGRGPDGFGSTGVAGSDD